MNKPPLVPGTYWDGEKLRWIDPDDMEWTEEGYQAAAGEPWMEECDDA